MAITATTTAKTKQDVDEMSRQDRLWDTLNYAYDRKADQLRSEYNKAISQQDRTMTGRGMQRSSAAMSALSGLRNQQAQAIGDNENQKIAAYEDRLQNIEEAQAQRDFQAEQQRLQNEWQSGENALSREQSQSQFDANLEMQKIQQAFQEKQWEDQQAQWREQFNYTKMSDKQKIAYNTLVAAAQNNKAVSDALLKQAGISRTDFNAMRVKAKSSGGGGAANWQKNGFSSYAEAQAAAAVGCKTKAEYLKYLAGQKNSTKDTEKSFLDGMNTGNKNNQNNTSGSTGSNSTSGSGKGNIQQIGSYGTISAVSTPTTKTPAKKTKNGANYIK